MNPIFFNLSKRKKRNILTDLLLGKSTEGIVSKKELNALNRLIEGPPSSTAPVKINNRPKRTKEVSTAGKKNQNTKRKKTHYLSQEISENLDRAQMTIRSLVPEDLRSRISKSHIVNQSLAVVLQEFEAKGKNSRLIRTIMQKT